MTEEYAISRYEKACSLLPARIRTVAMTISGERKAEVEEIRMRLGKPVFLSLSKGEVPLEPTRVIADDLEQVIDRATAFSRYIARESLRQGFVTAEGGFRVGICGAMRRGVEQNDGVRDFASLSIRIPRACTGIARPQLRDLVSTGGPAGTLILSPPGGGKTTYLRDLVRLISEGSELAPPVRVSLVDERGEIAALYQGRPQLDVGEHTDVLEGCPKAEAIPMLMRSMSPQVIAVDELALPADAQAVLAAAYCGVVFLATAHAASLEEIKRRQIFQKLLEEGVFQRAVAISGGGRARAYQVLRI